MAVEPEVLISSLLQKIERSFQSRNWVTKLARVRDIDRQRATLLCWISHMADNNRKWW